MNYEELRQYALRCGDYYRGEQDASLTDIVKGIAKRFPVPPSLAIAMAELIDDGRRPDNGRGDL